MKDYEKYTEFTKEELEKAIVDTFYGKTYPQMRQEKIPYVRQLGENSWEIFSGELTLRCNNAGKGLFEEALKDAIKKIQYG